MGLIEKAFENVSQTRQNTSQREEAVAKRRSEPSNVHSIHRGERLFDLDYTYLDQQGFFTADEKVSQLSMELRLLKRQLLRRLGFLRQHISADINVRRTKRQRNLVMVTSTRPAEGKTFTSINLALSLALEDNLEVMLVDADAPRPKVQAHFGLREAMGLTDLMIEPERKIEEVTLRGRQGPLTIIPEGSPVERSGELFGTAQAQKVIRQLSQYRRDQLVIIDAPPVLATTEAVILAPYVDEILFVVEADSTPEQAIASAIEELMDVNPNISLILNKCLIGAGGSHYGSYADYYPKGARRSDVAVNPEGDGTPRRSRS